MAGPGAQHGTWLYKYLPDHGFATAAISSSIYIEELVNAVTLKDGIRRVPCSSWSRRLSYRMHQAEMLLQNRAGIWEHGFPWAPFAVAEASRLIRQGSFR